MILSHVGSVFSISCILGIAPHTVVMVSVMVSEGKTTASDGCGSGLRQGLVQGGDKGSTRV